MPVVVCLELGTATSSQPAARVCAAASPITLRIPTFDLSGSSAMDFECERINRRVRAAHVDDDSVVWAGASDREIGSRRKFGDLGRRSDVPRKMRVDLIDRMLCDMSQDSSQVGLRIEATQPRSADQRVQIGRTLTAGIRRGEEVIFPSQRHCSLRAFSRRSI
jgi:hypothetical protein